MKYVISAAFIAMTASQAMAYRTTDCHTDYFGNLVCTSNGSGGYSQTRCHTDYFGNLKCVTN